ncbi:MAG TPA: LppP/LprE family lipoprotein [Mycobacteriales bacterium]|jgi:hypothetical protein|nr:LppP/LprE family lipoprotein [Mycobacteriales bacterium]
MVTASVLRSTCLVAGTSALLLLGPAAVAAASSPTARCGVDLSAPEIARAVAQVPRPRIGGVPQRWSTTPSSGNFDPCSRISGVTIAIRGGTAGSPAQVLLFAYGRYVRTAAPFPFSGSSVDSAASNPGELVVHYRWLEWNDTVADSRGRSTAQFRWNGSAVVQTGDLPPTPWVPGSALLTAADVGQPRWAAGKGVRPTAFDPCGGTAYPAEQHRVVGRWRDFVSQQDGQPVEGRGLREDVVRYGTGDDVAAAQAGYLQAARACPRRVDGTRTTTQEVLQLQPLIVRETSVDAAVPAPVAPTYYAFPRVGNLLALVVTGDSEGDAGLPYAREQARQARARLLAADSPH